MQDDPKKRTIYFVWNYTRWGGAQIYLMAIMRQARRDWNIRVILPHDSSPELIAFLQNIPVDVEYLKWSLDLSPANGIRKKISRQIRRIRSEMEMFRVLSKYDLKNNILHIEIAPWQSWLFLLALSLKGANIFVTLHNFLPRSSLLRETIWRSRFAFVSRLPGVHIFASNRDTLEKLRGWVTKKVWGTIKLTYTCVNPEQIDEAQSEVGKTTGILEKNLVTKCDFVVLCVGQFIDRKGRWVFLEAAKRIHLRQKDVRFIWLTPAMPDANDLAAVNAYGLGDTFRLVLSESVGNTRAEILRFFLIAHVFVLPSFVEGLPIALLEAMALGIPSVSTNVYAIPEAVRHMETGILVEAGDHSTLAETILILKNDPILRERLAIRGREFVLKNFDERDSAQIAIEAYKACLV